MDNSNLKDYKIQKGLSVIPGDVIASQDKGFMA